MDAVTVPISGPGNREADWDRSGWLRALPAQDAATLLADVRRLVVVSPHPDDEVLGCAGLMQAALGHDIDVHVVSVTDGEACYTDQPLWPAARLRDARRRELADAMRLLGMDATHVTTLGLPDGAVAAHEADLAAHLAAHLVPGDLLMAPWTHDAHPDHDAAGRAALAAAASRGIAVLQYPVWAWHWLDPYAATPPWPAAARVPLCAASRSRKQQALEAFATQTGSVAGLACAPILPDHITARFRRPFEVVIG
ncbi:PIG-L deacetylase family protein [Stenotrophomonas sp. LGBM10]|uniref:PIG-L deacetylase family protein n=1 Tax=Stenotrophomonas sp. LGBM10 TaxID=3390038 RepID=UPI00398A79F0